MSDSPTSDDHEGPTGPDDGQVEVEDVGAVPGSGVSAPEPWPKLGPNVGRLPPYPLDALPSWLADAAKEQAEQNQVDVDAVIMPFVAAIGNAAAKRVGIGVGRHGVHPTCLWVLALMPTGEGKTPLLNAIAAPFRDVQREWRSAAEGQTLRRRVEERLLRNDRRPFEARLRVLRAVAPDQLTDGQATEQADLERRLQIIEQRLDEAAARPKPTMGLCRN